jgi:hypothetical protein
MSNLKKSFAYYSNNHTYTEYSVFKTLFWKLGVLRRLLGDIRSNKKNMFINLEKLNSRFILKSKKPALICATGPSLNEISLDFIKTFQEHGDLFSVNYFPLTDIGSKSKIDFQLILDVGLVLNEPWDPWIDNFFRWLTNDFCGKLITQIGVDLGYKGDTIYLRGLTAPSFTKNINPMRGIVGFPSYTSLYAISIANWLGYEPIYVIGLDASQHSFIEIQEGEAVLKNHHSDLAYPEFGKWGGRPDVTSILSSNALVIEKMKLFRHCKVKILGQASHIDTLARVTADQVLNEICNN